VTEPLPDGVAYWLEAAEAGAARHLSDLLMASRDNPLGAGYDANDVRIAFWLGAVDIGFFNRCIGLGIGRPATTGDLDRVLAAFSAAGRHEFIVQLSPFARPRQLSGWLVARRLRKGRRWVKVWRDAADPPEGATSLHIEEVGPERRADWEHVTLSAFEMPAILGPVTSASLGEDGWHHYLSFDGTTPVGAGAMRVADGVAWLGFGATLETHRGRGSQIALLARRIRDAAALGAGLVVTETGEELPGEPNPSYRNMLRAGFRVGYFRQNWLNPNLK
jgi:hypothetical protein